MSLYEEKMLEKIKITDESPIVHLSVGDLKRLIKETVSEIFSEEFKKSNS